MEWFKMNVQTLKPVPEMTVEERRGQAAGALAMDINAAERKADRAIEATSNLLGSLAIYTKTSAVSSALAQPAMAQVALALQSFTEARAALVAAHKEMELAAAKVLTPEQIKSMAPQPKDSPVHLP
jgi:hypothetical protein